MKNVGLYSAMGIAILLILVGVWTLTTIGKIEPYELGTDDTGCCNGNTTDCCC